MTTSTVTIWLLISLGPWALIAIGAIVLGYGPALLMLLSNSKLARGVAIAAAVAWGLFVAAGRIRKAGRDEALVGVEQANAAAKADRVRIERDVAATPADEVSEELARWGR